MPPNRAFTMMRPWRISLMAALCGLLEVAPLAAEMPVNSPPVEYPAAPASTLLTQPELPFGVARVQREDRDVSILAFMRPGMAPLRVAEVSARKADQAISIVLRSQALRRAGTHIEIAALEHLYGMVLRQEPHARFSVIYGESPGTNQDGRSHAESLRDVARARHAAISGAGGRSPAVPWQVVTMQPWAPANDDAAGNGIGSARPGAKADQVGVLLTSDQGPVVGVSVYFSRAPHAICTGVSRADGLAACHLVDPHGDDDAHADDASSTLATFPGVIGRAKVLLPTTLVLAPTH
jgi:hypothetical protein